MSIKQKKEEIETGLKMLKSQLQGKKKFILKIKVIPQSSNNTIGFIDEKTFRIKLKAPREKGKANEALIKFLSEKLKIKPHQISIKTGLTSSLKILEIDQS